jgi:hypothetical protein
VQHCRVRLHVMSSDARVVMGTYKPYFSLW